MGYTLGAKSYFADKTSAVLVRVSKDPVVREIEGFKAWARAKDGGYVRVYLTSQESGWVDGTNEGAWSETNFDTQEQALSFARSAHRHLNR
jgi:hypothetical protein